MANIRLFKKKIKSAKNIAKITKAMQMVAASKMKRAQDQAESSREYSDQIANFSNTISLSTNINQGVHPLLSLDTGKEAKKELVLYIAPEKGLCGGLLTGLYRFVDRSLSEEKLERDYVVIGKKAKTHVNRVGGQIVAEFSVGLSQPTYDSIPAIARFVRETYLSGQISKVTCFYSKFINTLEQNPSKKVLLPLNLVEVEEGAEIKNKESFFVFEPSSEEIVSSLLDRYLEVELYQLILEAYASEQSARMIAMKNATDNAKGLVDSLTMGYNKERQAQITSELLDVSSATMVS